MNGFFDDWFFDGWMDIFFFQLPHALGEVEVNWSVTLSRLGLRTPKVTSDHECSLLDWYLDR